MDFFSGMAWQDIVFTVGQFIFIGALLPAVLSAQKPPLSTCLITGSVLAIFAGTYASLGFWLSAITAAAVSLLWFVLVVQNLTRPRV